MVFYFDYLQTLRFHKSNDIHMSQIKIVNSPQTHIPLLGCNGVELQDLSIISSGVSPNTDGIHIQQSNHIFINNSFIGVGNCLPFCLSQSSAFYYTYLRYCINLTLML